MWIHSETYSWHDKNIQTYEYVPEAAIQKHHVGHDGDGKLRKLTHNGFCVIPICNHTKVDPLNSEQTAKYWWGQSGYRSCLEGIYGSKGADWTPPGHDVPCFLLKKWTFFSYQISNLVDFLVGPISI